MIVRASAPSPFYSAAFLQAYFLTVIGFTPASRPVGWMLCLFALILAIALWLGWRWARTIGLALAAFMLCAYAMTYSRQGLAPCGPREVKCLAQVLSQPAATTIAFVTLPMRRARTFVGAETGHRLP